MIKSEMIKNKLNISSYWIHWFVGFTDAEGCFQVYPKKRVLKSGEISKYNIDYSFHLSLHKKDAEIIKDIRNKLGGIGIIYNYKNRNETRLAVNDRKSLLSLIDNIFEVFPLKTKSQISRYNLLKHFLSNNIKEFKSLQDYNNYKSIVLCKINTELDNGENTSLQKGSILAKADPSNLDAFRPLDNWIVGMINGEGCFYLAGKPCKLRRNFVIEHTDKWSLTEIKRRLDLKANVLERSSRDRDKGKNRKTTYQLVVARGKDIVALIEFLDNKHVASLQGNKLIQYTNWKQFNKT